MRTLLNAIAAANEALDGPSAEISFNVTPGAGTSVSTAPTPQTVEASFTQLLNVFGEPFFDALGNPMEGFDASASWDFSDSEGGVYTLSDIHATENIDLVASLRDSNSVQVWRVAASKGSFNLINFCKWLDHKIQEN